MKHEAVLLFITFFSNDATYVITWKSTLQYQVVGGLFYQVIGILMVNTTSSYTLCMPINDVIKMPL